MYEAAQARPDGASTVARLAATATEYGFDGLVIRNHGDQPPDFDADAIEDRYAIDVAPGVEVRAGSPSEASGYVGAHRPNTTVLLVHGGSVSMNRFAVESAPVDVLAHPMRGDGDLNHVLAKAAVENGVRLEFDFGPVLRDRGGSRVRAIADLRKQRELVEQYDVPYVVTAGAASHLALRAPRELAAVGAAIGFDHEAVEAGLEEWGRIVDRNRDRRSESFIEAGVELPEDEEADR